MPKFISERDYRFFKSISNELVNDVVQTLVTIFKINVNETRTNLYGESSNKVWQPGVQIYAIVDKEPEDYRYEGFGPETTQEIVFKFDRDQCKDKNVYPEPGDIILWDNSYYEIDGTTETQFMGGQPYNNFSIVVSTIMISRTSLNFEPRVY